ncbi:MAG: hypothetical protein ACXWN1_20145 [Thermoanaerobaculia bacterium]
MALAALASVWALDRLAYMPCRCNAEVTNLTVQTTAAEATARGYERLVRARRNLERLKHLRDACPTQVRIPFLIGANKEIMERPEDALLSYRDALSIEQRPEIYIALAQIQIQLGQVDAGVESYVAAARFAPRIARRISSNEVRLQVAERLRKLPGPPPAN